MGTKNYWINPNGKMIEINISHNEYAQEIIDSEEWDIRNFDGYPYQVLHQRGWIRVSKRYDGEISILGDCIDLTKPMRNTIDPSMNQAQLSVAKRFCKANGFDFHKSINDRRFH